MKPEAQSRPQIDSLLRLAGWLIQNVGLINLEVWLAVAMWELPAKRWPCRLRPFCGPGLRGHD